MSRFSRKNRTDIDYKGCGGLADAFDDVMKQAWYINDDEYDYICEHTSDDELYMIVDADKSFSNKRDALIVVDKYVLEFKQLED